MKLCPECGSNKVIMFDSNNDMCEKCGKWFPAVAEVKCVAGCRTYAGREIKHHKDCPFYPESFTKIYDDLLVEHKRFENDIKRVIVEIDTEILKNVNKPNLGKKGCVARLHQILVNDYTKEPEENSIIEELDKAYKDIANLRMAIDVLKGQLSDANQREYDLRLKSFKQEDKDETV